jgi:mannose-6-phosphate isomerase-like protein (cupin superfamily)
MKARIFSADETAEYLTDERCYILELANSIADPDASVARARVRPGVTTKKHLVAGTIERYVIVSGEGDVHVDGLGDRRVSSGDVIVIPPGVIQSVTNTGDTDLVFLCVCTPRFDWDNYVSLE